MTGFLEIPFFGRRTELAALEDRCALPGLTIVKGPPKIGKTRLLTHFVERSRAAGSRRIGLGQAAEAGGDVLLRAIKDAYAHWLQDASAVDQLRAIHKQLKGKYISKVGVAFGKTLAEFTGTAKPLVGMLFSGLEEAQQMLKEGGVQVPRLTSEQARDLLTILGHGESTPIVLVLNQWEEGQNLDLDVATLRTFLAELQEWPDVHLVLHLRDPRFPEDRNQQAARLAATLANHPAAQFLDVGRIEFETDEVARESVLKWLHGQFPALQELEDDKLVEAIDGHPAVLEEWAYLDEADRASTERLFEVAASARATQYPELPRIYTKLLDDAGNAAGVARLRLAILAAILPLPPDAEGQRAVLPAVLGDAPEGELTRLESEGLLRPNTGVPLSLGHPTRREAAQRCVLGLDAKREATSGALGTRLHPYAREAMTSVVPALVDLHSVEVWSRLDAQIVPAALTVASAAEMVAAIGADDVSMLLCSAVRELIPGTTQTFRASSVAELVRAGTPSRRTIVSMALFNAFSGAKANSERADALLDELRSLARHHADESDVQDKLARGLFNAFNSAEANSAQADGLLDELRTLVQEHVDHPEVWEHLARGLVNAISRTGTDTERADGLLDELRTLAQEHPEVREELAKGLFNAFNSAEPNSARADGMLDELRTLSQNHADYPEVREELAKGLFNAFYNAEPNSARADGMLDELRTLAQDHADEPEVREILAGGLVKAINNAAPNSDRADGLLDELRAHAQDHADDPAVREHLAKALVNAIRHAGTDSQRADALLDELGTLAREHGDEPKVREDLASGLVKAITNAEPNSARAGGLLDELRTLTQEHSDEPPVRENLASALVNAIRHTGTDSQRADALLDELRTLAQEHTDEAEVLEMLAGGLVNAINNTEQNSARADGLLDELRTLAQEHAAEAAVQLCMLRACGATMRARRSDSLAVATTFREAAKVLPRCATDVPTKKMCILVVDDAKAAHAIADESGKRAIDEAGELFWRAYRAKWPE